MQIKTPKAPDVDYHKLCFLETRGFGSQEIEFGSLRCTVDHVAQRRRANAILQSEVGIAQMASQYSRSVILNWWLRRLYRP